VTSCGNNIKPKSTFSGNCITAFVLRHTITLARHHTSKWSWWLAFTCFR